MTIQSHRGERQESTTPYRNLILAGTMGVGKREVAERVAARFNAPLRDLDAEIEEREAMPPQQVRELYGEARLHSLESDLCQELTLQRGAVVVVSGNTLMVEANRRRLQESGVILMLTTALNETLRRLHVAEGTTFHDMRRRATLLARLRREGQVQTIPGLARLDTTHLTIELVAEEVIGFWRTVPDI